MKIKFVTDFAGNWEAGDVVEAEFLPNGNTLVDNVACIDTALLMEHCEVVTESEARIKNDTYNKTFSRQEKTLHRS